MAKKERAAQPSIFNRKARYEYELLGEYEAGIMLTGTEVKSLRAGRANLQDAFAVEKQEEIWLHNLHISEYHGGNKFNHVPKRPRKLLLHKKEIQKLIGLLQTKGLTLIPLSLFFNDRGLVKVRMAVGRGKKAHDKRETEKERDWNREKSRILKNDV
jgi:SsrA-binding protein